MLAIKGKEHDCNLTHTGCKTAGWAILHGAKKVAEGMD